jgi:NAD(P)-dependent dehydrogenase (short-subunit alcohol dehydrogenase family)
MSAMHPARTLFDLDGRRALVTGASSGLGRHFALTLARAGAAVVVAARRVDRLAGLVAQIQSLGGVAVGVAMDVAKRDSVREALDEVARRIGVLDVVVNNAGVSGTKRPLDYNDEDWDAIVGTNLKGAWIVAQETARRMVTAQVPGSIINVSSILAERVAGGVGPYAASKAGLSHLTRALALELARHAIRVNSLAPGYVATQLNQDFLASDAGERLRARIPARRFGTCEDLDGALLLLASSAGAYISGAQIIVDGGHLCSSL